MRLSQGSQIVPCAHRHVDGMRPPVRRTRAVRRVAPSRAPRPTSARSPPSPRVSLAEYEFCLQLRDLHRTESNPLTHRAVPQQETLELANVLVNLISAISV